MFITNLILRHFPYLFLLTMHLKSKNVFFYFQIKIIKQVKRMRLQVAVHDKVKFSPGYYILWLK